jgi:ADP-heptose:LPS heptosyltransferase
MLRDDAHPLFATPGFASPHSDPAAVPSRREDREPVLVIRHGAFGDLIQADGALRDIRAYHPQAWISLLVAPQFARLMARCPHVDEVLVDPRAPLLQLGRNFTVIRQLRMREFKRVYDLQGSDRTRLYRQFLPSVRTWSRKSNGDASGIPDRTAYARQLREAHVPARQAETPDVSWMADDVSHLLSAAGIAPGYVALVPGGASRHVYRRWPYFHELARGLIAAGRQVVYAPGPDEIELVRQLPGHALIGADGFLDWFGLAGVLRSAAFVVGNDTGPTHLAACLGRPGLALFGARTNARRTGIRYRDFDAIEVADLQQLQAGQVLAEVMLRLA